MAALTQDKVVRYKSHGTMRHRRRLLPANGVIYMGSIVAINAAGYLVTASDAAGLIVVGISEEHVDNTGGADGAVDCGYVTGVEAELVNAGSAVVQATLKCTVVDDQSVSTAAVTTHDVPVGPVTEFTAAVAWVQIDEIANQTASS